MTNGQNDKVTTTERCIYCGGDIPIELMRGDVPELGDDDEWKKHEGHHYKWCDWFSSRAFQREVPEWRGKK